MTHTNRKGQSKLIRRCSLPITGVACVKKIVTDLAVLQITEQGFKLMERAPGVSTEEIISKTEANIIVPNEVPEMNI